MITSINPNNSTDYKALFQAAFDFLKDNYELIAVKDADRAQYLGEWIAEIPEGECGITSVQQYFSHIKDLLDIGTPKAKTFLMLPLDEPYFEINANTREIIVPNEFKKNGISVVGDEIAESLIFKINRFFDYADLSTMDVRVQWENANKETGTSKAFCVDVFKDADYIFVMWPLSSDITSVAGNLKFSLRFYRQNNNSDVLSYSFSTKIASAVINPGHNFKAETFVNDNAYDASGLFINSIVNSKNTAAEDANPPYFLINLSDELGDNENWDATVDGVFEAYIDPQNPTQTLCVEATAQDPGNISYQWIYIDPLQESNSGGVYYRLIPSYKFIQTEDSQPAPYKTYYLKGTDGNGQDTFTPSPFNANLDLWERTSIYEVKWGKDAINLFTNETEPVKHVAGEYYAIATNTVGDNTDSAPSQKIVFPVPKKLDIVKDLPDYAFLDVNGDSLVDDPIEITIDIEDANGATGSFVWEYKEQKVGGTFSAVDSDDVTVITAEDGKSSKIIIANGKTGVYRVRTYSTRNYEPITADSNNVIVCPALKTPVVTYPAPNTKVAISSLNKQAVLTVEVQSILSEFETEGFTYEWHEMYQETENSEPIDRIISGTTNSIVVPANTSRAYYCKVINHMGEHTAITQSGDFSVTPFDDTSVEPQDPVIIPDPITPDPSPVTPDPEPETPTLNIANTTKLTTVADDVNAVESQANQDMINVTTSGTTITVTGPLDDLYSFESTNPYQGSGKWVGIDINTNSESIIGMTWGDNYTLTQDDVDEAASVGLGAGHIIFWAKAENLPQTIKINGVTITVSFENTSE